MNYFNHSAISADLSGLQCNWQNAAKPAIYPSHQHSQAVLLDNIAKLPYRAGLIYWFNPVAGRAEARSSKLKIFRKKIS
ncbi:MAG: hypothetical protein WC236_13510 [Gallionellaceae bacterium]|jgi:hypothetical protein